MNNHLLYVLLMLFAGLGIPTMAALNSGLSVKLQSPILAVSILLTVGLTTSLIILIMTEGIPSALHKESTPWYFYLGGVLFLFYILSITWVAPRFGITNAVSFVLLGQLIAMSLIDHFGFAGAPQFSITFQRGAGLLLMAVGVFMVVSRAPATAV